MPIRSGGVKGKIVDGGKPTWHAQEAVPPATGRALSAPAATVEGPTSAVSSSNSRFVIHLSRALPVRRTVITVLILSGLPLWIPLAV